MELETDDKDGDDREDASSVPFLELKRTVELYLKNPKKKTADEDLKECESFLKESDSSMVIQRLAVTKKKYGFRLTFPTESMAEEVCYCYQIDNFKSIKFILFSFALKSIYLKRRKYCHTPSDN